MLAPADVESLLVDHLSTALDVQVGTALRGDGPQVVLFSTGGQTRTMVSGQPRIVFDCYHSRELPAFELARRVWAQVADMDCRMIGGVQVYDVTPTMPANYPHPDKPSLFRYQFNAEIHARHVGTN